MCQDTGVAVVYVTMGQDVHIVGGSLKTPLMKELEGVILTAI